MKRLVKELNEENIMHNVKALKKEAKGSKFIAVVKSNAYGHGMIKVVNTIDIETDMYAVANIDEAVKLRKHLQKIQSQKDILILGYFDNERIEDLLKYDITQGITNFADLDIIEEFLNTRKNIKEYKDTKEKNQKNIERDKIDKIKVHIKFNTNMNRLGFDILNDKDKKIEKENIKKFFEKLSSYKNIIVDGIFSHIAYADNRLKQKDIAGKFDYILNEFKKHDYTNIKSHLLNSAGILNHELKRFDYVRGGISLYGLYPSYTTKQICKEKGIELKSCLTIKTKIINLRNVTKGEKISYEGTFVADKDMVVAIIPVGYDDGYLRAFSNKAKVEVNDKLVSVVGNVCMNMTMIDVTDLDVKLNDEVILLGSKISAEDLAKISQTISYEVFCNFKFE